jgi:TolB-like protein
MPPTVHFGPYVFDPGKGTLQRNGAYVALGRRGAALLGVLIEAESKVVTKAELIDRIWSDVVIEEANLAVQVATLRKALGTRADGVEWIATIPRVGYRFVGDTDAAQAAEPRVPQIAVLPFQNMSGDTAQDYFADGVVEDITTALSRFRSFAVIARNSSFAYKGRAVDVRQIAAELGVQYLLEGSIRKSGDRLRITAQLVEGAEGAHIWAQNFDGELEDIFDFQDRITESVVGIIEPRIQQAEIETSRRERPGSLAAYDLYLRALPKHAAMSPERSAEAMALLDQALAIAPTYAVALKVATDILSCRLSFGWPALGPNDREKCLALTERALACAAGDATVMAQCGAVLVFIARDFDRGLVLVDRAIEANPNNAEALTCAANSYLQCGSLERALTYALRGLRLSPADPLNEQFLTCIVAQAHLALGNYPEALAFAERTRAINPRFEPNYWFLVAAYDALGRADEARRALEEALVLRPYATVQQIRGPLPDRYPERTAPVYDALRRAGLRES